VIEDMVLERERDEELAFEELLIAGKVRLLKRQSRRGAGGVNKADSLIC